jgi:hypothetical protein
MRIIRIELPVTLTAADPSISLASDEIRRQLFRELRALDHELSEVIRQRAKSYFPESYAVFVRTLLSPDRVATTTELWIVDPTIRWPAGLLTRRAWRLFVPILSHIVRDGMESKLAAVTFDIDEADAQITVFGPTRTWRDPVVIAVAMFLLTTLYWFYLNPMIGRALAYVAPV